MIEMRPKLAEGGLAVLTLVAFSVALLSFAGWLTHVIVCFKVSAWVLLVVGAVAFPVGVVHGIGHWLGAW